MTSPAASTLRCVSRDVAVCAHCGNPIPSGLSSDARFCCPGCETVHAWIEGQGLGRYYDLKSKGARVGAAARPELDGAGESYEFLDRPEFLELYGWAHEGARLMQFYLEGVHCSACVWLTEKLPELPALQGDVLQVRLNLGTSLATVRVREGGSFSRVASQFRKMGYRPHPVRRGESGELQARETRSLLIRAGVAGACSGNIMLLAVSLYAGATGALAEQFRWVSFALFLPVLTYSAVPFYKSAWASLKTRRPSIDLPVALGTLIGSAVSITSLFRGGDALYFDSTAMLVFLLLCTRLWLRRLQQQQLGSSHLLRFLTPISVRRWNASLNRAEDTPLDRILVGDVLQVLAGETIPVDGLVLSGTGSLDRKLLTGEACPEPVAPGQLVFAGTSSLDATLKIQVTQSGARTRMGRILQEMEHAIETKPRIVGFTDRVSGAFVATVLALSLGTLAWALLSGGIGWEQALSRAIAIAIVTCPCTFALATPLVFSLTLGKLARRGVLVKSPDALERLTQVRSVLLDKTGTLTTGEARVSSWLCALDGSERGAVEAAALAIESLSRHPFARSIAGYLQSRVRGPLPEVSEFKEILGHGASARVGGHRYELTRGTMPSSARGPLSDSLPAVDVSRDGERVGTFRFVETIFPGAEAAIDRLRAMGFCPRILSGDSRASTLAVASRLGIPKNRVEAEASPERKQQVIALKPMPLMVGDGANDAIALASAHVSVAVHSGVEISLRAADIYLSRSGVAALPGLIDASRATIGIIRRNFAFALVYNAIAAGLALHGEITPLMAAVLMPASALTVFASSLLGSSRLRRALEEIPR